MLAEFINAMRAAGVDPGARRIIADGKIHRFCSPDDKPGRENCWYVLFEHGGPLSSWRPLVPSLSERRSIRTMAPHARPKDIMNRLLPRLVALRTVAVRWGVHETTIRRMMVKPGFPSPVRIGSNKNYFVETELLAWLLEKTAGAS
jgi:predicted DNA-binding transcriptional regulator AlpA